MSSLPIKLGDKGQLIAEVQKYLALLHYDVLTDGIFGQDTEDVIKNFQKNNNLVSDGIVGENTYQLLKNIASFTFDSGVVHQKDNHDDSDDDLEIITDFELHDSQFVKTEHKKTQIFLHFTAGAPSAKNVIQGWDKDSPVVATAYVIDGNTGDIYNCFNDKYYAYHLGIKGVNGTLDKASVGIEICCWGPLTKKNDKYYNYVGGQMPEDQVYKLDKPFRGYSYFHAFTDSQLKSLEKLLRYLIKKYDIKVQKCFDESMCEFDQSVIDQTKPGIWTHTVVRQDKSDFFLYKEILDILNKLAEE